MKIKPHWYSLSSPESFKVNVEMMKPLADSKRPVPPSTRQLTVPAISPGTALGPR